MLSARLDILGVNNCVIVSFADFEFVMNKKHFSERDICTKFITPALEKAGWNVQTQIREKFSLTKGRIIVRGKLHTRGKSLLFHNKINSDGVIEREIEFEEMPSPETLWRL